MIRTYSELIQLPTFEERLKYCMLFGKAGEETFGFDRYLNQGFYHSAEWKSFKNGIVSRDMSCDLGCKDHPAPAKSRLIVHHLNPLTKEQVKSGGEELFDPENVITVTLATHNAIHYGDIAQDFTSIERKPYDTCPWKGVVVNG